MEHTTITPEVEYQLKYLFLSHSTTLQPDLGNHCLSHTLPQMIKECLTRSSFHSTSKPAKTQNNVSRRNYCNIKRHKEKEGGKKKKKVYDSQQNFVGTKHNKISHDLLRRTTIAGCDVMSMPSKVEIVCVYISTIESTQ